MTPARAAPPPRAPRAPVDRPRAAPPPPVDRPVGVLPMTPKKYSQLGSPLFRRAATPPKSKPKKKTQRGGRKSSRKKPTRQQPVREAISITNARRRAAAGPLPAGSRYN
jgi:hypothetical protein